MLNTIKISPVSSTLLQVPAKSGSLDDLLANAVNNVGSNATPTAGGQPAQNAAPTGGIQIDSTDTQSIQATAKSGFIRTAFNVTGTTTTTIIVALGA